MGIYYYTDVKSLELVWDEDKLDKSHPRFEFLDQITEKEFYKLGAQRGAFFWVSQSKIKTWRRCHRSYYYKYVLGYRKRIKGRALYMGSMVHECIELHLKGKAWRGPLKKAQAEIDKMFVEERVDLEGVVEDSYQMVRGYIKRYKNDGYKATHVELKIRTPLVDNIILEGKVDALVDEIEKHLRWQMEHKTCAFIPDEKNRMGDIQTVIYNWAIERMGMKAPIGVIWDYLVKKVPRVPELLANGKGLSKNKSISTTQEVYAQAIIDNDLDPEDYVEILESLEGKEDDFHRRIKMPTAKVTIDSVVDDFVSSALQMRELGPIATDRNQTRDCSWCDEYDLCQADLRGGDTEGIIKRKFTTREQRNEEKSKKRKKITRKSKAKK